MRAALVIAAHHIRRMVKNPGLLLLLLAIPMTISLIEYAAFGRTAAAGKLPPIKVLMLDEDDTFASQAVPQLFTGGPIKDQFDVGSVKSLDEAKPYFRRGEASAVVRVPKGFQDALLDGRDAEVTIYRNPSQSFAPDIAESVLEMGAVVGNGLYLRAKEPLSRIRTLIDEDREPTTDEIAAISVGFFLAGKRLGRLEGLDDVEVKVKRAGDEKAAEAKRGIDTSDFFATIFPGLTLFSLLFVSQALVFRLLRDRVRGIQRRLMMVTSSAPSVLAGSVLYLVAGLLAILLFLSLVGSIVFRIHLREPVAMLAIGLGFAVFAAGLLLAIGAASRDDKGAAAISSVVIIVLSLVGGSMMPVEILPGFLKTTAMALPNGASQFGLTQILVHKKGLADVSAQIGLVWMWAVATLGAAVWFEGRRLRQ